MPDISTGSTAIPFGANLRIGYRLNGSVASFTYVNYFPGYNELPYTFSVPSTGEWEIEYAVACPTCGGSRYSDPETVIVTVT